jgi:hypothetical protein
LTSAQTNLGDHSIGFTAMKKLLLPAFIAVACEAMAQDGQCVRERAALVETIRANALPSGDCQSALEMRGDLRAISPPRS